MRDHQLQEWRALVRERANAEWRELSRDVVDELAGHLADHYAAAIRNGATDADARRIAVDALRHASLVEVSKRPRSRIAGGYWHDFKIAVRQLKATPTV